MPEGCGPRGGGGGEKGIPQRHRGIVRATVCVSMSGEKSSILAPRNRWNRWNDRPRSASYHHLLFPFSHLTTFTRVTKMENTLCDSGEMRKIKSLGLSGAIGLWSTI